jgi:hypothetical protein
MLHSGVFNFMNPLTALLRTIERLCLENEVARIMLQEYWPPAERISSYAALNQNCSNAELEFRSRAPIAKISLSTIPDAPGQCTEFLQSLTKAIGQTREQTFQQVEKMKGTL